MRRAHGCSRYDSSARSMNASETAEVAAAGSSARSISSRDRTPAMRVSSTAASLERDPVAQRRDRTRPSRSAALRRGRAARRVATLSASAIERAAGEVEVATHAILVRPRDRRGPDERATTAPAVCRKMCGIATHSACHAPMARSCSCVSPTISVGHERDGEARRGERGHRVDRIALLRHGGRAALARAAILPTPRRSPSARGARCRSRSCSSHRR